MVVLALLCFFVAIYTFGKFSMRGDEFVIHPVEDEGPVYKQIRAAGAMPLEPGEPGVCYFHAQVPHEQDIELFVRLGGSVSSVDCVDRHLVGLANPSEAMVCPCVAPKDPRAFNRHFLEIGALDGQYLSNLLFFEAQMGWTGVCVEGNPISFRNLQLYRPRCHKVGGIVSNTIKSMDFYSFSRNGSWESSMSCAANTPTSAVCSSEARARQWASENDAVMQIHTVKGYKLSDVFAGLGWTDFGWLMVDVEGAEYEVIKTIDFSAVRADYISFEGASKEVNEYLSNAGYLQLDYNGIDTFMVPNTCVRIFHFNSCGLVLVLMALLLVVTLVYVIKTHWATISALFSK